MKRVIVALTRATLRVAMRLGSGFEGWTKGFSVRSQLRFKCISTT